MNSTGEPVEQLRVDGWLALRAEILDGARKADTEEVLPQPVDEDPRRQRVVRRRRSTAPDRGASSRRFGSAAGSPFVREAGRAGCTTGPLVSRSCRAAGCERCRRLRRDRDQTCAARLASNAVFALFAWSRFLLLGVALVLVESLPRSFTASSSSASFLTASSLATGIPGSRRPRIGSWMSAKKRGRVE